jgi:hypothetical protein
MYDMLTRSGNGIYMKVQFQYEVKDRHPESLEPFDKESRIAEGSHEKGLARLQLQSEI